MCVSANSPEMRKRKDEVMEADWEQGQDIDCSV